jgi:3-oxoadipate enol-lactonase
MASYVRFARYIELDGVGHLANLERPLAFNAALDDFLKVNMTQTRETAS